MLQNRGQPTLQASAAGADPCARRCVIALSTGTRCLVLETGSHSHGEGGGCDPQAETMRRQQLLTEFGRIGAAKKYLRQQQAYKQHEQELEVRRQALLEKEAQAAKQVQAHKEMQALQQSIRLEQESMRQMARRDAQLRWGTRAVAAPCPGLAVRTVEAAGSQSTEASWMLGACMRCSVWGVSAHPRAAPTCTASGEYICALGAHPRPDSPLVAGPSRRRKQSAPITPSSTPKGRSCCPRQAPPAFPAVVWHTAHRQHGGPPLC